MMLRDSESSAPKPVPMDAKYGGLQLVWSRDWKHQPAATIESEPKQRRTATLAVAAAAVAAALLWVGHAVLR